MKLGTLTALAASLALANLAGCASFQARGAFSRGQKARDRGELSTAIAAFEEAHRRDPANATYDEALRSAKTEVVRARVEEAEAAEARGDYGAAVKAWDAAMGLTPEDERRREEGPGRAEAAAGGPGGRLSRHRAGREARAPGSGGATEPA